MAFQPTTDIVMDVARAADPNRAAAAQARLTALAAGAPADGLGGGDFSAELDRFAPSSSGVSALSRAAQASDRSARVQKNFEAMTLGALISEMMPKEQDPMFGVGQAGQMWKSMLATQMARKIADSGALKLADRLFKTHPMSEAPRTAQMSANPLSAPQTLDIVHGAVATTRRTGA